jgi:hypothetical protein
MIRVFHSGSRIRILILYLSRIRDPDPHLCSLGTEGTGEGEELGPLLLFNPLWLWVKDKENSPLTGGRRLRYPSEKALQISLSGSLYVSASLPTQHPPKLPSADTQKEPIFLLLFVSLSSPCSLAPVMGAAL